MERQDTGKEYCPKIGESRTKPSTKKLHIKLKRSFYEWRRAVLSA
jgi:hypothetical protein